MIRRAFVALFFLVIAGVANAADVDIGLTLEARGTDVRVTVRNAASAPLRLAEVSVELESRSYTTAEAPTIEAGGARTFAFTVAWPPVSGSYPLIARVAYWNGGERYSLVHVGEFHVGAPRRAQSRAELEAPLLQKEGTIKLTAEQPERWILTLPEEVAVLADNVADGVRTWRVRGRNSDFTNTYPIFVYRQDDVAGGKVLQLVQGTLRVDFRSADYPRGALPHGLLLTLLLIFGGAAFVVLCGVQPKGAAGDWVAKVFARYWLLLLGYWVLRELPVICGALQLLPWIGRFFDIAKPFTLGPEYRRFFTPQGWLPWGVADLYGAAVVVISPVYSWFCDRVTPWREDKYAAFVAYVFSLPWRVVRALRLAAVRQWRGPAKLGFLTCCVKVFFIPLLCAWVIQNSQHMANLTRSLDWSWPVINRYLREACIFVDTAVFCVGYTVEAVFLRNRIRSVEPTFLGWIVCLWCYPPLNAVSFQPFTANAWNVSLRAGWLQGEIWTTIGQALITLSWVVFAWASVALGFKASNLTNRGIVTRGPYRFCRHPAYTVKILGWLVGAVFFAEHGALGMFGLALIYFLRAWTEERHLGLDPEYRAYCSKVRYRFVPGVV
jgi:Putative protein-S-isoprenylcysteine methyltransferase